MKVLLTGILGFIGSHVAERLTGKGHEVYGVIRRVANRNMAPIARLLNDITLVPGDITSYVSARNAIRTADPDVIIHLAALSPVRDSFESPFEYVQANLVGTMNVAHALLELQDPKRRRLVAASTAEVYGLQKNKPLKENLPLRPSSPYAVSRAAGDLYVQMMFNTYDLHGTILRPANSYGRKFGVSFLIEYLVTQMLKGKTVHIGAPDSVRDYLYVDDHVNGYLCALESKRADKEVFNLGTGVGVSNRTLADMVADKIGFDKRKIKTVSYPPGYPYRPLASDQPYVVLDASKAKKTLNWRPTISLDEGLDKVIAYFKDNSPQLTKP